MATATTQAEAIFRVALKRAIRAKGRYAGSEASTASLAFAATGFPPINHYVRISSKAEFQPLAAAVGEVCREYGWEMMAELFTRPHGVKTTIRFQFVKARD